LTDSSPDRTLRAMIGRRLAMFGGALWQITRLVVVVLLILRVLPEPIPFFHISILWAGAGALLLCGLFLACGIRDSLGRNDLALLRLGTLLMVAADAAVVISRSFQTLDERLDMGNEHVARLVFVVSFGILVVDLLIFITLVSYRGDVQAGRRGSDATQSGVHINEGLPAAVTSPRPRPSGALDSDTSATRASQDRQPGSSEVLPDVVPTEVHEEEE